MQVCVLADAAGSKSAPVCQLVRIVVSVTLGLYMHARGFAACVLTDVHLLLCQLLPGSCCLTVGHSMKSSLAHAGAVLNMNLMHEPHARFLQTLEMELPDTAASIRLSSLELSDCMSELSALGSDVSAGVRATAQLVRSAEAGMRQGASLVGAAVVPALARRETRVRGGSTLKSKASSQTSRGAWCDFCLGVSDCCC